MAPAHPALADRLLAFGNQLVALSSAAFGVLALVLSAVSGDWTSLVTVLGVVLLLNAVVRLALARRQA